MAENIPNRKNDAGPHAPADQVDMDAPRESRPDLEASSVTDEKGVTYRTIPPSQE